MLIFSHRPDVSLANPLGPPVGCWEKVESTLERIASLQLRESQAQHFERISEYAIEGLACVLEIEHRPGIRVGDSEESKLFSLRATTVWRLETDGWRIAHRHADPITTPRPLESIFE